MNRHLSPSRVNYQRNAPTEVLVSRVQPSPGNDFLRPSNRSPQPHTSAKKMPLGVVQNPHFVVKMQRSPDSVIKSPPSRVLAHSPSRIQTQRNPQKNPRGAEIKDIKVYSTPRKDKSLIQGRSTESRVSQYKILVNEGSPPQHFSLEGLQNIKDIKMSSSTHCSQQHHVNLLHARLVMQLQMVKFNTQSLDQSVTKMKEDVLVYYDRLQEMVRSYRKHDMDRLQEYERSSVKHLHQFQNHFNRAIASIINIRKDYEETMESTHSGIIGTLEDILRSYDEQKVKKISFVHRDPAVVLPFAKVMALSEGDSHVTVVPPQMPSLDAMVKFESQLGVKKVQSNLLITNNNAQFSFVGAVSRSTIND